MFEQITQLQKSSQSVLVGLLVTMMVLATMSMRTATAYTGNGYDQGRGDFLNNYWFNRSCDPSNGDSYCAGIQHRLFTEVVDNTSKNQLPAKHRGATRLLYKEKRCQRRLV